MGWILPIRLTSFMSGRPSVHKSEISQLNKADRHSFVVCACAVIKLHRSLTDDHTPSYVLNHKARGRGP